jgi:tetratricopeptide (TPR) repeat protein
VDGYPLGIELAAAWVEKMELDEIASLVERDLSSLVTTMRDVPRRHRSMRAVFEGSWEMLGEHGRSVLVALSIFSESFDRAGGMAVAKTDEAGLRSLEDKSLLYRDTDGRFSCHELIQQFAMERLEEYGPEFKAGVWRRYVRHYLWLVREKAGLLGAVDSHSVLGEVQIELANIQKAWRLAVSNADFDSIDRVIDDLAQLCRLMGLFRQGEAMFGEAVSQLRRQIEGKPSASAETHRRLGRLLINLAAFLNSQAKHKQAWMVAGTALGHFEEVDDPPNRAVANLQLGESLRARGELESAQEHAQRALGIARAHGLRQIEADGLLGLSDILLHRSGYAEAEMQAAQALAIYREIGHRRGEAMALNRLGDHAIRRGDCSQAWDCYERSRQVSRQIGDLVSEREGMLHLGIVLAGRGIYEDALVSFEQALPGFRESGWRLGECRALRQMGLVYLQLGHLDAARNCLEPALRISRGIKNREDEAALLSDFGWLAQREEQHDTARMYAEKAIEVCREIDHPGCERDALTFLGHALMALRQPKEAQWAFGEAMALQATVNPQLAPVEAMAGLAHALFADGRVDEAMGWVGKVLTHLERRPDMPETREPLWIYWAIYRVLKTCEDPRAERVLVDARILLNDRASRIADEQLRLSYLESRPYYLE